MSPNVAADPVVVNVDTTVPSPTPTAVVATRIDSNPDTVPSRILMFLHLEGSPSHCQPFSIVHFELHPSFLSKFLSSHSSSLSSSPFPQSYSFLHIGEHPSSASRLPSSHSSFSKTTESPQIGTHLSEKLDLYPALLSQFSHFPKLRVKESWH